MRYISVCLLSKMRTIMKLLRLSFLSMLVGLLLASCYDEPDFGVVPELTNIDIYFKKGVTRTLDSLVVRVDFQDGDGDLGFYPDERGIPYTRKPNPNTDEPFWRFDANDPDLPPYNFIDYEYTSLTENDTIFDTLYVERNEDYYNYSVTIYTKEENGYQPIELINSPPLGGRFFPLKDDLDLEGPLKGTIQYGTVGAYDFRFSNDTLRMDVVVRDRAGHVSNVISREGFTLDEIEIGVEVEEE